MLLSKIGLLIALAAVLLLIAACSVPFDVETTPVQVELGSTYGTTVENTVDVPSEARRDNIDFDKVVVHYTVSANSSLGSDVNVRLYVSSDQTADNSRTSDDETIFDTTISPEEQISGNPNSEVLRDVLNAGQASFVLGGEVTTEPLPDSAKVIVDMYAELEGSYQTFP